mmetsp:Transcript_15270/g.59699  ORF Transcript_15270/g.59699 Transcript_15270/m.59699 type:complete len:240 (-) Transcript_15270:52-771(-)
MTTTTTMRATTSTPRGLPARAPSLPGVCAGLLASRSGTPTTPRLRRRTTPASTRSLAASAPPTSAAEPTRPFRRRSLTSAGPPSRTSSRLSSSPISTATSPMTWHRATRLPPPRRPRPRPPPPRWPLRSTPRRPRPISTSRRRPPCTPSSYRSTRTTPAPRPPSPGASSRSRPLRSTFPSSRCSISLSAKLGEEKLRGFFHATACFSSCECDNNFEPTGAGKREFPVLVSVWRPCEFCV